MGFPRFFHKIWRFPVHFPLNNNDHDMSVTVTTGSRSGQGLPGIESWVPQTWPALMSRACCVWKWMGTQNSWGNGEHRIMLTSLTCVCVSVCVCVYFAGHLPLAFQKLAVATLWQIAFSICFSMAKKGSSAVCEFSDLGVHRFPKLARGVPRT